MSNALIQTITIENQLPLEWIGETGTARITPSGSFLDAGGAAIIQEGVITADLVIDGRDIIIPAISVPYTFDSPTDSTTRWQMQLFDESGIPRVTWPTFPFALPASLGATPTWDEIILFNVARFMRSFAPDAMDTVAVWIQEAFANITNTLPANIKRAEVYGTLAAAYIANPTDEVTLWITEPLQPGMPPTQPDNIQLMFSANGRLATSTPQTVVLTRPPIAASDQWCFDVASGALAIECGGSFTKVSAQWFGAVGDGVTDDYVPLQAALDALTPQEKGKALLYATETNEYYITQTLYTETASVTLEGIGADAQTKITGAFRGPLYCAGKLYADLTFATSLLSGSGNAVVIPASGTYLSFNDVAQNLNGLAQMSVELTVKATAYSTPVDQYANLFSSFGVRSQNFFTTVPGLVGRAFEIKVDGAGKMLAYATIGGTLYTLTGGAGTFVLNANNNLHLRYNGTTLALYNNGTLVSSTAATGTVTQKVHEDLAIGPTFLHWPEDSSAQVVQAGKYDNIRISNTARSTSNPTAKFTADANTLLLQKFLDTSRNPILPVEIGASGTGYQMARCSVDGNYTQNINLRNIHFYNTAGPCAILHGCPTANLNRVNGSGLGTAFLLYGIKYLTEIDQMRVTSFGSADCKIGIAATQGPGAALRMARLDVQGYGYPLALVDGATSITDSFINLQPESITGFYSVFGTITLNDVWIDIESNPLSGVTREGFFILSGCFATTQFTGGKFNFGSGVTTKSPCLTIDSPYAHGGLNMDGVRFLPIAGTSVIVFTGTVLNGNYFNVNLNNAVKLTDYLTPSTVPWILASDEDVLNVQELGKTTAPRALDTVVSAVHAIDNNRTITYGLGTIGNLLIPSGLPTGMTFKVVQTGSSAIQLVAGSGVTMTAPSGALSNGANSIVTVMATGTNTYLVTGNVTTSVFTPLSLSPKQWYAGNHILGYSNTDPINSWIDSSGNDYHMTPYDNTHRPEYKTALKNSLAGVFFDATTSFDGEGLGNLDYGLTLPCTLIAVYAPTATGLRLGNNGALTGSSGTATLGTSATNHFAKAGATTITAGAIGVGTYVVAVLTIDGSGNAEYFINNVSIGTATVGTSPGYMLLGQYNNFPNPLIGNGLEFLVFDSALSGANLTAIYNYLVAKWALP